MEFRLEKAPHRVVDEVLDTLVSLPPEISEKVSRGLDKGPLGSKGPHRAIDTVVKGVGKVLKDIGETAASVLDKPTELVR